MKRLLLSCVVRSFPMFLTCRNRVVLASVLIGCSVGVVACSTREPNWNGKNLSHWVGELNHLDPDHSDAAEEALAHIGTNAIPYLISRLTSRDLSVSEWLEMGGGADARGRVVSAFCVLGSSATNALPTLGTLLTNEMAVTNIDFACAVAQSMACIGETAKPWLTVALTHPAPTVRQASLLGLIDLGGAARDLTPQVVLRLNDEEPEVRGLALFFVSEISNDDVVKQRAFTEALHDKDKHIRSFAEKEMEKIRK